MKFYFISLAFFSVLGLSLGLSLGMLGMILDSPRIAAWGLRIGGLTWILCAFTAVIALAITIL